MMTTITPPTRCTPVLDVVQRRADEPRGGASPANTSANPSTKTSVAGTARAGSRASAASPTMIPR